MIVADTPSGRLYKALVPTKLAASVLGFTMDEFAPGIVLVHGFGLAISKAARVSEGCILFHGVTLGMGRDGKTGATGAPLLERDVHVGVGATLVGPITIGRESKIMAGCTVTQSVPARSLVEAPAVAVRAR